MVLSGLAHVTVPEDELEDLWIDEGDVMIAADTIGKGHITDYPLDKDTHALQIPFKDGVLPAHRVIRSGVCHASVNIVDGNGPTQFLVEGQQQILRGVA